MFTFKVTGGKGQYTELTEVQKLSDLQPGQFYFCKVKSYALSGEELVTEESFDFAHVELMDQKIGRETVKNVKVVRFLKGKTFLGVEARAHVCNLSQLPACTFFGPMEIMLTHTDIGQVIGEIE